MLDVKICTSEDLIDEFHKMAEKEKLFNVVNDKEKLLEYLATESNNGTQGFYWAPASTKYHGNYAGGLYEHSRQVYLRLKELTENNNLKWQRPQSPFIIGMFHDLCKCDQYKDAGVEDIDIGNNIVLSHCAVLPRKYEYNTNTILKGHGSKSVMILSQFINLTEEEMLCIRYHMGAYEKEEWTEFDMAIRKYQNVFWTHAADMLASKVDDV